MRHLITAIALFTGITGPAQNYTDIMELLQADLRNEKHAIVMAGLDLTPHQDSLFRPIYDEYSAALKAHWEERLALVDDFAQQKEAMSDQVATTFMKRLSALEKQSIDLRDAYAKRFTKVLPATLVARWVQLERRLGQLMELQIANEVPLMPTKGR